MSNSKTPITILQELCAKQNRFLPKYDHCDDKQLEQMGWDDIPESLSDMKFFCRCEALNLTSIGGGLSKKDSKHSAATHLLQKYRADINDDDETNYPNINNVSNAVSSIPNKDAISILLDICVQRMLPKAEFQEIEATGPSHAPSFTFACKLSSLTTKGKSQSKKSAKQIAAGEMLKKLEKLHPDCEKKLVTPEQCAKIDETATRKKIQTYLDYRKLEDKDKPDLGVKLKDRHNFYSQMDEEIKKKIMEILEKENLEDDQKIQEICEALEYNSKNFVLETTNEVKLNVFELLIEFEKFTSSIMDEPSSLNHNVIQYFQLMFNQSCLLGNSKFLHIDDSAKLEMWQL